MPAASATPTYLAGLRLTGRRVLVVGGGRVAARRVPALVGCGAVVRVVAPDVVPSLCRLAAQGSIAWSPRTYRPEDLVDAWYVLAATDDAACNAAVSAGAEEQRTFCVRADDRERASAWTPATAEVDGITLGVLTGTPRRTRRVRDLLVAVLRAAGAPERARRPAA